MSVCEIAPLYVFESQSMIWIPRMTNSPRIAIKPALTS